MSILKLKIPQNLKYKKYQKICSFKKTKFDHFLYSRNIIIARQGGYLTIPEIEAFRKVIVKYTRRKVRLFINLSLTANKTQKPSEVRRGKGKGSIGYWVCPIRTGQVLFFFKKISKLLAKKAFLHASKKLSIATKIIV